MEDEPGTVFYLAAFNENPTAMAVIKHPKNRKRATTIRHMDRNQPVLRIGMDQKLLNRPYLAKFGRGRHNDVILDKNFSRNDQCYFDFNKDTGELLLHDLSEKNDTQLYDVITVKDEFGKNKELHGSSQIWKSPRHCAVVLAYDYYNHCERKWIFRMRNAQFWLIPRGMRDHDEATLIEDIFLFISQPDPDRTTQMDMQGIYTSDLQFQQSERLTGTCKSASTITWNSHNTRLKTPLEPEEGDKIHITKLRPLGGGSQGEVHKVVDMHTGAHHACKFVAVKSKSPLLKIHSEDDFRARVKMEVELVRTLPHPHIVPYTHTQGFKTGQNIQIFMQIYECNLLDLLKQLRPEGPLSVLSKTKIMLCQMLDALDFVHTRDPSIIHRDVKPPNILYRGDQFFLTDFGIAKVVDESNTFIGTEKYMAPDFWNSRKQTTKVDIWALGVTVMECLEESLPQKKKERKFPEKQQLHEYLQAHSNRYGAVVASMLTMDATCRPTAGELLGIIRQHGSPTWLGSPVNATFTSGNASTFTNDGKETGIIYPSSEASDPMDWTPAPTPAIAFSQGSHSPIRCSESMQPNSLVIQSQNEGSAKSVKSSGGWERKRKRSESSQDGSVCMAKRRKLASQVEQGTQSGRDTGLGSRLA